MKKGSWGIVYQEVMRNPNISAEAKAIYAYLASIVGTGNNGYPSIDTMQREMCMSKNRRTKYMRQLIAAGVVEKVRERNGNIYGHNIYKITHEAEVIEYQQIAALYNSICVSFLKLTKLSDKRKKLISGEV